MRGLRERERLPIVTRLAKVSPLGRTVVLKVVINNRGIFARETRIGSSLDIGGAIVVRILIVRSVIVRRIARLKLRLDSRRFTLVRIGIVQLGGILDRIFGTITFGIFVGFSLGIFRYGLPGQHPDPSAGVRKANTGNPVTDPTARGLFRFIRNSYNRTGRIEISI